MTSLNILSHLRHVPFEPLRLVLLDGAKYDIRHPDLCMVMKREVVVGVPDRADELTEDTLKFHYFVTRIEALPIPEASASTV